MSDRPTPETNSIIRNAQAADHPPTRLAATLTLKCEKLERERDEAREEIKEWKTLCLWGGTPEHIHGFIRGQQSRIQHLERERDEARDALMRIEDLFIDGTDIYADREKMGMIARSALEETK